MTPKHSPLVEVIARATFDATLWPGAWEKANDVERGNATHVAIAALAAIDAAGMVVVPVEELEAMRAKAPLLRQNVDWSEGGVISIQDY